MMVAALTNTSVILFLLSALLSAVIAHDAVTAADRFLLIAVVLLASVAWRQMAAKRDKTHQVGRIQIGCGWLAGLLGIYFMATGDKNVLANALIVLIPLGCGGFFWYIRRDHADMLRSPVALLSSILLALALLAFVWLGSRSEYIALTMAVIVGPYVWWRTDDRIRTSLYWVGDILVVGSLLALVLGLVLALVLPIVAVPGGILQQMDDANAIHGRITLWQDSLALIEDYRYTGSGLGVTGDVYSAYLFLLHRPYLSHAHNLYLQIAVEQGIPGLVAFVIIVFGTIWTLAAIFRSGTRDQRLLAAAATAALAGILVHGFLDAGLYASRLVPLLFLPFAVTWSLGDGVRRYRGRSRARLQVSRNVEALTGALIPLATIALLFFIPGTKSALQSNLGAVSQTRTELGAYTWPTWPLQDLLRREQWVVAELKPAMRRYHMALEYSADNVTAHRRLGQIALSTGEYETALAHLEAAYVAAPNQRVVRRLLGEAYAVTGQLENALAMWQSVPILSEQLKVRQWWYKEYGEPDQQRRLEATIAELVTMQ